MPKSKITMERYHGMTDWLSSSMLKMLADDPVKYYAHYEAPEGQRKVFKTTPAMDTGSVIHAMLLEKTPIENLVGVYPDHDPFASLLKKNLSGPARDKYTNEEIDYCANLCGVTANEFKNAAGGAELKGIIAKAKHAPANVIGSTGRLNPSAAEEWRAAHPNFKFWAKRRKPSSDGTTASYETLEECAQSVLATAYAELLQDDDTICEQPIFWIDEDTGLRCRCCPDALRVHGDVAWCWDVKVTTDVFNFSKSANRFNYHLQDEHYTDGIMSEYGVDRVIFQFLTVLPVWPYHVVTHRFKDDDRDAIRGSYHSLKMELLDRRERQDWSHPASLAIQDIQLFDRTLRQWV